MRTDPERVLVVFPGALGDVLLTRPALQALRLLFPDLKIDYAGPLSYLKLFRGELNTIFDLDGPEFLGIFSPVADWPGKLRRFVQPYTKVIIWSGKWRKQALCRVGGTKVYRAPAKPAPGFSGHISRWFLNSLKPLFPDLPEPSFPLPVLRIRRTAAPSARKPFIAVHPGSGSRRKNWPLPNFLSLANMLRARTGLRLMWLLGPAEAGWKQQLPAGDERLVQRPLEEVAAVLKQAALYVGNDSGISHLAAQLGCPTVVLFLETEARVWHPVGPSVHVITEGGSPDLSEKTVSLHRTAALSAGEVFREILSILKTSRKLPL